MWTPGYSIFENGGSEFQQGQLPPTNLNLGSLPSRGDANCTHHQNNSIVSNQNIHNNSQATFYNFPKEAIMDQIETTNQSNSYYKKNDYRQNYSSTYHQTKYNKFFSARKEPHQYYRFKYPHQAESFYFQQNHSVFQNEENKYYMNKYKMKQFKNQEDPNPYGSQAINYNYNTPNLYENNFNNFENYGYYSIKATVGNRYWEKGTQMVKNNKKIDDCNQDRFINEDAYQNNNNIQASKFVKNQQSVSIQQRSAIKLKIESHKDYFKPSDWDRLLYILQQIILENKNGVRHLWYFINNFEQKKKYRKGKRVFEILALLGLDEIFDKLITQQNIHKQKQKQKESRIKTLIFNLVKKIE